MTQIGMGINIIFEVMATKIATKTPLVAIYGNIFLEFSESGKIELLKLVKPVTPAECKKQRLHPERLLNRARGTIRVHIILK